MLAHKTNMLKASHRRSALVATGPAQRQRVVVRIMQDKLPVDASAVVGERVGQWLSTPWDVLTFPARAGAGALVSMPERLQTLQSDVQRLVELVQDPRPVEEKQDVLRQELESTVLEFLEKGVVVEQDVLSNLKTILPPEAASVLNEFIPDPPNKQPEDGTVVAVDPQEYQPSENMNVTYGQQDVMAIQIANEIDEIRNAVAGLKSALDGMRTNTDAAASNMLRLKLREARDQLQRRLAEVSPATEPDPTVSAATREARILLDEVNAMFFQ